MIIAIDGPAGAGKSTVAREVARVLGITYLDTGAMYRAVTWIALERGLDPGDAAACGRLAHELALDFDAQGRIHVDGRPGEPHIRSERVTASVSQVSSHPEVRRAVVARQREFARRRDIVAEGRDTTTVVFPQAEHKFYLTADERERARRRALELGRGADAEAVRRSLGERDRLDSTRVHSPLRQAPGAVRIDTDGLDVPGVVARILSVLGERGRP
jgi:cytidylate kinase